jgi:7,8-dihydropterin-6-yl-methyl-4-(beta-D-ribofuranosyl)aminobenzene 5'-phosphate synthase
LTYGKVKIIILVDNQSGDGLIAEHGLSLWVEADGKRILFDTGQGPALPVNASRLGVDLEETDILVLSHGHYDHTGGVADVLRLAREIEVYFHAAADQIRYSIKDGIPKPIRMPHASAGALEKLQSNRLHRVSQPVMISRNIGLSGPITRVTEYEDTGGPFYLDQEGSFKDPIVDDMALWINSEKGLVVCVGCGHAGLINTLNHVRYASGISRIHAVIGGFHLLNANAHRIDQTIKALRSMAPGMIAPCHCTGERIIQSLKEDFGKRVISCCSGTRFEFESAA